MASKPSPEWSRFRVGKPSKRANWTNQDCRPLETVSHVTHIDAAVHVVSRGVLQAGLVYDESKLRKARILVNWLSPNDWSNGFRYGNVQFTFDWEALFQDMDAYWVESIPYRPRALRILLTERDRSSKLEKYDPTDPSGPWWYDTKNDIHYWNGDYCLEIMVERDLCVREAIGIDFVRHHPKQCCIDPNHCPDRGLAADEAGALFIAALVAGDVSPRALKLTEKSNGTVAPRWPLSFAWRRIGRALDKAGKACTGTVKTKHAASRALARAILHAYVLKMDDELRELASLFASKTHLVKACATVVCDAFGIPDWKALESDEP